MSVLNKNDAKALRDTVGKIVIPVLDGSVWDMDPDTVQAYREALGSVIDISKACRKVFDEGLKTQRANRGADFLANVEYFRKPRESKVKDNTSILDSLNV